MRRAGGRRESVSILVLLEVPLRQSAMNAPRSLFHRVSILVLLEVPLRRSISKASVHHRRSFNPCFAGSSS